MGDRFAGAEQFDCAFFDLCQEPGDESAGISIGDEPADAADELVLHTRFSALRYHRADAHAAAWQAAGLTSTTITELAAGPARDAIEAETNRRNGLAYATLSRDERAKLLAGLAALDA